MKVLIKCKSFKVHMGVVKAHVDEAVNRVTMIDLEPASRKVYLAPNWVQLLHREEPVAD